MVQAGHAYARRWEEEAYITSTPGINYKAEARTSQTGLKISRSLVVKTIVFLFAYALLLVYLCIKSSTLGYQIVKLENDIASLETVNHSISCRIAQQTSLKRIELIATRDLGMHRSVTAAVACMNVPNANAADKPVAGQSVQAQNGTLQSIYKNLRHLANKD